MGYETIDALTEDAFAAYRAHLASNPGDRANVCEAPGTTHRMRAALVLAGAWGQCVNGGPHQYVDNGIGHRRVAGGEVTSAMAAAGLVEAARAADPEVADAWIDILTAVARIPDRDDHRKAAQVLELSGTKGRFDGLVALGHARVERFLAAALDAHDPSADPFATAWRPEARKGGPRHPDVTVDLSAVDGNANAIIGKVSEALRRARVPAEEIAEFRAEARSGTFDKVLGTVLRWVDVELGRDDEHGEGMDEDEDTSFAP